MREAIETALTEEDRGFATGVFLTSPPASFALAHATSPPLGTAFGPLRVFLLHATVAVVGGYAIGILQELSVVVIPTEYKSVVGLALLVVGLLTRPDGLFGEATR